MPPAIFSLTNKTINTNLLLYFEHTPGIYLVYQTAGVDHFFQKACPV